MASQLGFTFVCVYSSTSESWEEEGGVGFEEIVKAHELHPQKLTILEPAEKYAGNYEWTVPIRVSQ